MLIQYENKNKTNITKMDEIKENKTRKKQEIKLRE